MKKLLFCLIVLSLGVVSQAHPWKPNHYVIIDTDGGIDDMRAICMMLASPDVRVLAIISSSGALNAENAYIKVSSLLRSFYHEGLPVAINRNRNFRSPDFAAARTFAWGDETGIDPASARDYLEVIGEILSFEKSRISFICLGGMNTVSEAVREIPELRSRLNQVVWSCNGLDDKEGFNYSIDRTAAARVISLDVPVKAVISRAEIVFFDRDLIERIGKINTAYGKKVNVFLNSGTAATHSFSSAVNDELVPLFLHYPELFRLKALGRHTECTTDSLPGIKDGMVRILKGETVAKNQVIKVLPVDPAFYFPDIEPFVNVIIERYGVDEWVAGVFANELHRHLGVFAIIGVKMGIRAREYFNTGVDEFRVVSFAGSTPPLSCMNDGIQVSTGATPGHGLLSVSTDTLKAPVAEFTYLNHTVRLRLRPETAKKISDELREINFVYGLDSNIYWELVRKNSIKYWKDLDRHEIFIIEGQ